MAQKKSTKINNNEKIMFKLVQSTDAKYNNNNNKNEEQMFS